MTSSPVEPFDSAAKPRPDLAGIVEAKDGSPIQATVFIYTAGPKVGTSPFCPSCYADCQKSAKADEQGRFQIDSLDPQLVFRVLAAAKGFRPQFIGDVDPTNGLVTIKMDAIELASAGPGQCLHGRVTDAQGKSITGATVSAEGIRGRNGSGRWGSLPGVDPLAVTDENGEFLITSRDPFDMMDVRVEARGSARRTFAELDSGSEVHQLVLTEGAAIRGRVTFNGKPLKNVSVGVVSVDRTMGHFTGNYDIGTDADGRFLFTSLPPDVDYYVYGHMDSLKAFGSIPIQKIHAGKDGDVVDVGELKVGPANSLKGRVVLADGGVIPPQTRLLLSRDAAWDSVQLTLAADGSFNITGLPSETVSLSLRLPGYKISAKNASLDTLNTFQLIGRVEGDITNLIFLLEKGEGIPPDYDNMVDESQQPRNRPLHGAEVGPDHSHQWVISGRVADRQNGDPISCFVVIPGQAQLTWNQNHWDMVHHVEGANGSFIVYVDQRWATPELKIMADGYLPTAKMLNPESQTNVEIVLEEGVGPAGRILLPDGRPAAKADVILICADSQQPGFDFDGHLNSRRNAQLETTTDTNGTFFFAPQIGMRSIAAATKEGFTQISIESLKTNGNPCASAQVALQVPRKFLALGKAAFRSNQGSEEGWIVQTKSDGSFTLPMYEGAQSVIAVSDDGFANVNLHDLKKSPQVHLQAWGKIEGELRVGRHAATNAVVSLSDQQRTYSATHMNQAGYKTNSLGFHLFRGWFCGMVELEPRYSCTKQDGRG